MAVIDQEYYTEVPAGSLAERVLLAARERMFRDFIFRMRPSPRDEILDVGVSDAINNSANVLERSYQHQERITACGLGLGIEFKAAFPLCRYLQIEPNVRLPFADSSFDIAASNAVLEHVGSYENQMLFVKELCRVAKRVFLTVPNKFFPIEHHTALPLSHFQNGTFRIACEIAGKPEWSREENLILMTRKQLWRLAAPITRSATVGYTGLLLGPFSSNLYLAIH